VKILLAIDGSRYSADAIDVVAMRPWPRGTTVRVLYVAELDVLVTSPGREAGIVKTGGIPTNGAEELVNLVTNSLRTKGLSVASLVLNGDPREAIVNEAKNWAADLIVVSAYGHSGIRSWRLGQVAESVVQHAPCSVEVVRKIADARE
jgi:nucleotide-binding universal stress UspA family protein